MEGQLTLSDTQAKRGREGRHGNDYLFPNVGEFPRGVTLRIGSAKLPGTPGLSSMRNGGNIDITVSRADCVVIETGSARKNPIGYRM